MGIAILLFLICLISSTVGSIVGAGGGVIIKPVLDMIGILPVSTVSFCSGCTVLAMAVCSLLRGRKDGVGLELRTSTILAVGAVLGGLVGKWMFARASAARSCSAASRPSRSRSSRSASSSTSATRTGCPRSI